MQLSEHFSLEELTASNTAARKGIDNMPGVDVMIAMTSILAPGLERVRSLLGKPIHVNSGYRCRELNRLVGGQPNSQHMEGLAADIICPEFGSPLEVCRAIAAAQDSIGWDQCIFEFASWAHISFPGHGKQPRNELLTIDAAGTREGLLSA